MDRRVSYCLRSVALLGILACLGCGGRRMYPVEGQVVWADGTPAKELAGGMVQFDLITDNAKESVSPQGIIGEDGRFRLGTAKPGDGAPPGKYRVLVMPLIWTEGMLGDKPPPPPVLDPRFQSFDTSGLEVVVEAKSNDVPIKVERIRKR
jgi:hypothetical protein